MEFFIYIIYISTIAPRNLNKIKLKEIMHFQVEKYAELMKQFKDVKIIKKLKFYLKILYINLDGYD